MPAGFGRPSLWKDTPLTLEGQTGYWGFINSLPAYPASNSSPQQCCGKQCQWGQQAAMVPWHASTANKCTSAGAAHDIIGFVLSDNLRKAEPGAEEW